MAILLLFAFIAVPVVEIAVFIQVGGLIGLWPTIATVILTAVIGTTLLRRQGISILFRIQENLEANRMPVQELFDGICLVLAGALLLTPGFVTDALGFLLFVPPLRRAAAAFIAQRFLAGADIRYETSFDPGYGQEHRPPPGGGPIIDGDFEDVTPGDAHDRERLARPNRPAGKDDRAS